MMDEEAADWQEAQRRKGLERATVAGHTIAIAAALAGALVVLYDEALLLGGVVAFVVAMAAHLGAMAASMNVDVYRVVGSRTRGSSRYERLRRWTRLKTSSALHSLLILLGALLVLTGMLSRIGIIDVALTGYQGHRAMAVFMVVFVSNAVFAHHQSLYIRLDPDRTAGTRVLFWTGLQLAVLLAAFAAYIGIGRAGLRIGGIDLRPSDALVLLVAALTTAGVILGVSRGLPSIFSVMSDPRMQSRGGYVSRTKAVVMPTIVAFTLLFVFVLLIVVFGAGIFTVLGEVGRSPSVLIALAVMVVAVVVGLVLSLSLARQEDRIELFRTKRSRERNIELIILGTSLGVGAVLLLVALSANRGAIDVISSDRWIDFASLGLLTALGPYGFYWHRRYRHIQQMEARFPDLLRDLASSHRGGLTLVQSAQVASRGDYGALTPEVQRLADQLTWHVSFDEAFVRFADRVNTPLVQRSVNLVLEAGRSGGNTTDVLLAASRDAREIKSLERERQLNMSVYTTVIYVTFFVFLFVIGVLVGQFLPEIVKAGEAAAGGELDAAAAGIQLGGVDESDYRQFYFLAGAVQAIGNGMLAGIMGSGKAPLGLRHAFFMVLSTYIAFRFII